MPLVDQIRNSPVQSVASSTIAASLAILNLSQTTRVSRLKVQIDLDHSSVLAVLVLVQLETMRFHGVSRRSGTGRSAGPGKFRFRMPDRPPAAALCRGSYLAALVGTQLEWMVGNGTTRALSDWLQADVASNQVQTNWWHETARETSTG